MKINIYYGGRGLIGDPTLYVLNKMQEVLRELNVNMERYDLYEFKNNLKGRGWRYSCDYSRMVRRGRMDAAVFGFLLAVRG